MFSVKAVVAERYEHKQRSLLGKVGGSVALAFSWQAAEVDFGKEMGWRAIRLAGPIQIGGQTRKTTNDHFLFIRRHCAGDRTHHKGQFSVKAGLILHERPQSFGNLRGGGPAMACYQRAKAARAGSSWV